MSALSSYYASKGLALVAFERFLALRKTGTGGNHCHVNVIGVPKEAVGKAQDAFQQALKAADLGEFEVLQMGEGECWDGRLWEGRGKEAVGKAQDASQQALKVADVGESEVLQRVEGECRGGSFRKGSERKLWARRRALLRKSSKVEDCAEAKDFTRPALPVHGRAPSALLSFTAFAPSSTGAGASALQAALRGSLAGAGVGHASCFAYPKYLQALIS